MVMPADSAILETLDTLGTPLLRLDAGGAVVFANLAMARWLGVGQRRLLGLHAAALQRVW